MATSSRFNTLMGVVGRTALNDVVNSYPHAVEFQERLLVNTADGDPDNADDAEVWVTFATANAKVESTAAVERMLGIGQQIGQADLSLSMEYVAGLTTAMRMVFDGVSYYLTGVYTPGERQVFTVVQCRRSETV
jgi:head-tail adaptor